MRDEILCARSRYWRGYDAPPTQLFLSPEAYCELLEWVRARTPELKTLVGAKFCGMEIHIVPTLTEGFYVA